MAGEVGAVLGCHLGTRAGTLIPAVPTCHPNDVIARTHHQWMGGYISPSAGVPLLHWLTSTVCRGLTLIRLLPPPAVPPNPTARIRDRLTPASGVLPIRWRTADTGAVRRGTWGGVVASGRNAPVHLASKDAFSLGLAGWSVPCRTSPST